MKTEPNPDLPSNVFAEFLTGQRGGRMAHELSLALSRLCAQVTLTGNPGVLQLKLRITPAVKKEVAVIVEDTIDEKPPKVDEGGSIFWLDNGRLTRTSPSQRDLPFAVAGGAANPEPTKKASEA